MYVSVTSLTLVQGKVMGMLLDFFPLLIQRCAALLRVREKKRLPLMVNNQTTLSHYWSHITQFSFILLCERKIAPFDHYYDFGDLVTT